MNQEEQIRLKVLNSVLERRMGVKEAAGVLGLSERHTWRILAAYRSEGAASLAQGNRGRRPSNAVSDYIWKQVLTLANSKYHGFNHTHLAELLAEREGLTVSRCTVRNILLEAGIKSPRCRRAPRHRTRRERMAQAGMLLQVDGSSHDWLEGRGLWLTLLLAVDDATGQVHYAVFRRKEDTYGYFLLFDGLVRQHGIPLVVYHHRHAALGGAHHQDSDPARLTQLGRALKELGVKQIFARSPEAKGRVERTAGTFQDRLVSELRLAQVSTLAEANRVLGEFLSGFNARFGVVPREAEAAYRPLTVGVELESIFCFKHVCRVARDNTVTYQSRTLQLLPEPGESRSTRTKVEVRERLDGSLTVYYQGQMLRTQEAPPRASQLRATGLPVGATPSDGRGEPAPDAARDAVDPVTVNRLSRDRPTPVRRSRGQGPTHRQQARWHAIQAAQGQGMSVRKMAQALGISRNTVRTYLRGNGPPSIQRTS